MKWDLQHFAKKEAQLMLVASNKVMVATFLKIKISTRKRSICKETLLKNLILDNLQPKMHFTQNQFLS
jgi:hypothetical protein